MHIQLVLLLPLQNTATAQLNSELPNTRDLCQGGMFAFQMAIFNISAPSLRSGAG